MIEYNDTKWMSEDSNGNIPDGAPAINAENLLNIESGIKKCVSSINALEGEAKKFKDIEIFELLKGDVVWTNPNSETDFFPGQTIPLDLSKYERFTIVFRNSVYEPYYYMESNISRKGIKYNCLGLLAYGADTSRFVTFYDDKVEISNEVSRGATTNATNSAIPVEIIGYKC